MKQASPLNSARRSMRMTAAGMGVGAPELRASIEKDNNRPPIYVPSRREPAQGRGVGLRDSLNGGLPTAGGGSSYQPKTSFSYVPSAEV